MCANQLGILKVIRKVLEFLSLMLIQSNYSNCSRQLFWFVALVVLVLDDFSDDLADVQQHHLYCHVMKVTKKIVEMSSSYSPHPAIEKYINFY